MNEAIGRLCTTCRHVLVATGLMGLSLSPTGCAQPKQCSSCIPTHRSQQGANVSLLETERCVDPIPHGAIPAEPGTYVHQWGDQMAAQADQQQQILTRNLWFDGSEELGPDGQERIMQIAESLQVYPHLVLIEEEPIDIQPGQSYAQAMKTQHELNSARRVNVIHALRDLGVEDVDDFVTFTTDRSVGVRGIEAPTIFNRQFMGGQFGRRGGGGRGGLGGRGGGLGGGGGFGGGMFGGGGFGGGGFGGGGFGGGGIF